MGVKLHNNRCIVLSASPTLVLICSLKLVLPRMRTGSTIHPALVAVLEIGMEMAAKKIDLRIDWLDRRSINFGVSNFKKLSRSRSRSFDLA